MITGWNPASLPFPADSAVAGILKNYAILSKLVADAVRRREIAPLPRGLPLGHERFDFSVARSSGNRSGAERAEFFRVVIAENRENGVERFERGKYRSGVALAEFAAIHGDIHFADQIEDCRERLRGVQIIRKPAVEIFPRLHGATRHLA